MTKGFLNLNLMDVELRFRSSSKGMLEVCSKVETVKSVNAALCERSSVLIEARANCLQSWNSIPS